MGGVSELVIRPARIDDAAALHDVIVRAYQGGGWTHEGGLLAGTRIEAAELTALLTDPARMMLVAERDGRIAGGVDVIDRGGGVAYLGLLSVDPAIQAAGIGRRLIAAAEAAARESFGATVMELTVIRQRPELIAWYERRGYARTGEGHPFPHLHSHTARLIADELVLDVLARDIA